MTLAGADFLVKLATIAVAFVGWSAIAVSFRRALGYELDALHMYFVRFFIEGGLAVAAFGLIPSALALTRLEEQAIWRLSSAAAALTFTGWFVCLLRRRRRAARGSVPLRTVVHFVAGFAAAILLWANAYGLPAPSPGAYAIALVTLLVVGGCVFAQNLEFFFSQATEGSAAAAAAPPVTTAPTPVQGGRRFTVIHGGATSTTGLGGSAVRARRASAQRAQSTLKRSTTSVFSDTPRPGEFGTAT